LIHLLFQKILTEEEKLAQEKLEEERLLKKTTATAPPPKPQEVKHIQDTRQQKAFEEKVGFGKKVLVIWLDRHTGQEYEQYAFYTKEGRLPVEAIKRHWRVRNLVWTDIEEEVEAMDDGYSNMSFEGINIIKVWADRV